MKTLGVIGGLGPMATAYFLQLITQMTDAATDQEHMEILIHSKPQIPDRTKYILGESQNSPVEDMVEVGRNLVSQGAEVLAMPCITAHYFQKELESTIGIPIINGLEETALYLKERGYEKIGIMATDGTIQSRIFQGTLEKYKMQVSVPGEQNQKKVMHLIYDNVKAGKTLEQELFEEVTDELFQKGVQIILLGCTELSLIKKECTLPPGFLDVMEVLAQKAVLSCACLKEEYKELITCSDRNI